MLQRNISVFPRGLEELPVALLELIVTPLFHGFISRQMTTHVWMRFMTHVLVLHLVLLLQFTGSPPVPVFADSTEETESRGTLSILLQHLAPADNCTQLPSSSWPFPVRKPLQIFRGCSLDLRLIRAGEWVRSYGRGVRKGRPANWCEALINFKGTVLDVRKHECKFRKLVSALYISL